MKLLHFFRHLLDLRRIYSETQVYRIQYTHRPGTFFLRTLVEANSPYEACRAFDTNPENSEFERHGPAVRVS